MTIKQLEGYIQQINEKYRIIYSETTDYSVDRLAQSFMVKVIDTSNSTEIARIGVKHDEPFMDGFNNVHGEEKISSSFTVMIVLRDFLQEYKGFRE